MNKILLFGLLSSTLLSCTSEYTIEGKSSLSGFDGKIVYLKTLQGTEWVVVDSARVIHGLFSMKGRVDSVMMTTLFMDDEILMPLIIEKGNMKVALNYSEVSVRGTPMNNALYDFLDKRNEMDIRMEDVQRQEARMIMEGMDMDEVRAQLAGEEEELAKEIDNYVRKFISDNYGNILGPNVFLLIANSLPYPMLTPQLQSILDDAPHSFKDNAQVREYISLARENRERIREQQRLQQRVAPAGN